jgi:hypothetical protein
MQGFSLGFCGTFAKGTSLLQYNFTVPLRNLNFISSKLVHGPPATPAATGPRVRPFSLIFLYKMFFFPSFHVPNSASWRITSASYPRTSSRQFFEWLSLFRWPMLLLLATSSATLNKMTGRGGSFILYGLPSVVCPRQCGMLALRTGAPSTAARWGRTIRRKRQQRRPRRRRR